jgi:hypothetical protein
MRAWKKVAVVGAAFVASAAGGFVAQSTGSAGANSLAPRGYNPRAAPQRILDTRSGAMPQSNQTITVATQQAGSQAVSVNIALTETAGPGFVTAWDCVSSRPLTSVINSTEPNENISNFVIVPVNSSGHFCLFTNSPTHIVVDLMGNFTPDAAGGGGFPTTPGLSAQITGYAPGSSITQVTGVASNNSGSTKSFRVDIRCPNGTVETDSFFSVPNGETRGVSVLCTGGGFTSGASVLQVVQI